jgi:hypothetical protein
MCGLPALSDNVYFSTIKQLSTVRELSIMSPKSPPVSMRLIPERTDEQFLKRDSNGSSDLLSRQPSRYILTQMLPGNVLFDFYLVCNISGALSCG